MRRVIATGKPVGIVTGDETLNRKYLEIGCTFVAVGVDAILFAKMLQELAGRYKTSRPASI
jgi:4-hydroxy-2-oxoheptanedioate aldolase